MSFPKHVITQWQERLKHLYTEREVSNMFYVVLEDFFTLKKSDILLNQSLGEDTVFLEKLNQILSRLESGEPVQQIIGFTYFDDLKIITTKDVLIPRPETEELVHWIAEIVQSAHRIVDYCSGSGCIAFALKMHFPKAEVLGVELSDGALKCAQKNRIELQLDVAFQQKDVLLENLGNGPWDIIVSNPPYIPQSEHSSMHTNVLEFEPHMALFVDEDPLIFYTKIAQDALESLSENGYLFFELHENYALQVVEKLKELGFNKIELKTDLQGKNRMLKAQI